MSQKVKVSVLELKSQLKVFQKPTSGNKDVLIERLGWANLPQSFDMFNDSSSSQLDGSNDQESLLKFTEGAVYKRIPKASRLPACLAFTKILQNVINNNDIQAWANLFNFARCAIGSSSRGGKKHKSQATILNKRIDSFMTSNNATQLSQPSAQKSRKPPLLKNQVSAKIAVINIQGAVRVLSSKDTILPYSLQTSNKLKEKHPQSHPESQKPCDPQDDDPSFSTNKEKLVKALHSFKKGAAGGPDGLIPQHLLDMCGEALGEPATRLIDTIATFLNTIVYPGKVPSRVKEIFYGANLIALKK